MRYKNNEYSWISKWIFDNLLYYDMKLNTRTELDWSFSMKER
jgi:hypothetical protein